MDKLLAELKNEDIGPINPKSYRQYVKKLIVDHSDQTKFEQYTEMRGKFIEENPDVKFGFEIPSMNSSPMRSAMLDGSPTYGPHFENTNSDAESKDFSNFSQFKCDSEMPAGCSSAHPDPDSQDDNLSTKATGNVEVDDLDD